MLLGKFDKCVVHESMKNVSDPELAYLVTCYTGMVRGNRRNQNIQMRRTQTLFSGDFCDELYWNPKNERPITRSTNLIPTINFDIGSAVNRRYIFVTSLHETGGNLHKGTAASLKDSMSN